MMKRKTILTRLACWILSICMVFPSLPLRSLAAEREQTMNVGSYGDILGADSTGEKDQTPEPEVKARNIGSEPKLTLIEIDTVENADITIQYKYDGVNSASLVDKVTNKDGKYKTELRPALKIGAEMKITVKEEGKLAFTKIAKVFEDRDGNGIDDTIEVTYLGPVVARNIGIDGEKPEFTTIEIPTRANTKLIITFNEEGKDEPTQESVTLVTGDKYKLELNESKMGRKILLKPGSQVTVKAQYFNKQVSIQSTKVFDDLDADGTPDEKTEKPTGKAVNLGKDPKATTISGSAEPGARIEAKLGESLLGETQAVADGTYSLEVTKDGQALEEGVEIEIFAQGEIKAISDPLKIKVEVDLGEVEARIFYFDESENPIESKYRLGGEKYPEEITAKEKDLEELVASKKAPNFLSYRLVEAKLEPNKDDRESNKTIKYIYKKLADIIAEDEADDGVKANYTPVTFKADPTKGRLKQEELDGGSQKLYYVNPVERKTIGAIIDEYMISAEGKKDIYKLDESKPWNISPDQVALSSIIGKEAIDLEANFVKEKALVTYEFVSATEDRALPSEGMPNKPEDKYYEVQSQVTAENKFYDPVSVKEEINGREVVVGRWIFKGWTLGGEKAESLIVSKAGPNKFIGLWEFEEASKALIGYKLVSATEDKALPSKGMPELPKDADHYIGEVIESPMTTYEEVPVKENINGKEIVVGRWTFTGWSPQAIEVEDQEAKDFIGTWTFTEKDKGRIEFKFTPQGQLPSSLEVTTDDKEYYEGEKIRPEALTITSVEGTRDGKEGTWSTSWTPSEIEIKKGVNIVEIPWTFTEKDKKGIDFTFKFYNSKKPDEEISASVLRGKFEPKVPEIQASKYVGSNITLASFEDKVVNTGDLQGRWKFDGWYRGDTRLTADIAKVSPNGDENKLVGKWILDETAIALVSYKFVIDPSIVGGDKDIKRDHQLPDAVKNQMLDLSPTGKYVGNVVEPVKTKDDFTGARETIDGKKGNWTFVNWDKDELTVSTIEANNVFTGTWTWEQEKSGEPEVKIPKEGDKTITGKGGPESDIELELADGTKVPGKVDKNGNWSIEVPEEKPLKENDKIRVSQIEEGKKASSKELTVEKGKAIIKELRVNFEIKQIDLDKGEFIKNEGGGVNKTLVLPMPFDASKLKTQSPEVRGINGYEFIGWDRAFEGELREDTTFYALFKKLSKPEPEPKPVPQPEPKPQARPEESNIKANPSPSTQTPKPSPSKDREVNRVLGENRIQTAIEVSQKYYDKADTVVIANAGGYPDALSASSLAKALNAPILLNNTEDLNEAVKAEILRLGAKNVVIVGGVNSISGQVEEALAAIADKEVKRVSGDDRYETSVRVARELSILTGGVDKAVITSGEIFADALAAAPLAAKEKAPILLVRKAEASQAILEVISDFNIGSIYIAGGYKTVDKALEVKLPQVIERFAGQNRYETAALIAKHTYKDAKEAFVASGENWPDALVMGPVAAKETAPILLTGKDGSKETKEYMEESKIKDLVIVGGENTISQAEVDVYKKIDK